MVVRILSGLLALLIAVAWIAAGAHPADPAWLSQSAAPFFLVAQACAVAGVFALVASVVFIILKGIDATSTTRICGVALFFSLALLIWVGVDRTSAGFSLLRILAGTIAMSPIAWLGLIAASKERIAPWRLT